MKSIAHDCPHCKKYAPIEIAEPVELKCLHCAKTFGKITDIDNPFTSCPICQCKQFYIQKDFNQLIGCLVMGVGIVLVPKTYGLSLPLFALLDWVLYRKVKTMVICYKCGTEFRGFSIPEPFKPFLHHIGAKYDKFRK